MAHRDGTFWLVGRSASAVNTPSPTHEAWLPVIVRAVDEVERALEGLLVHRLHALLGAPPTWRPSPNNLNSWRRPGRAGRRQLPVFSTDSILDHTAGIDHRHDVDARVLNPQHSPGNDRRRGQFERISIV